MDRTDDPVTLAWIVGGSAIAGAGASVYQASQNRPGSPGVPEPGAITETPGSVEEAKKSQKRKQKIMASVMTQDWDKPMLSEEGLLGVS